MFEQKKKKKKKKGGPGDNSVGDLTEQAPGLDDLDSRINEAMVQDRREQVEQAQRLKEKSANSRFCECF